MKYEQILKTIMEEVRSFSEYDNKLKAFFRTHFLALFESLLHYTQNRVNVIEHRVMESTKQNNYDYNVFITLMTENQYKLYNDIFSPICLEDLLEKNIIYKNLENDYWEDKNFTVKTIYLDISLEEENDILEREFQGYIDNYLERIPVTFKVTKSQKYDKIVEKLYHTSISNRIKWKTLNMFYTDRMYDIYIEKIHKKLELHELNLISDIHFDLEEYEEKAFKDHFIVWNINTVKTITANFPQPLEESINYRHILNYYKDRPILVSGESKIFLTYQDSSNNVNVITKSRKAVEWEVYEFLPLDSIKFIDDLDFKIFSNKRKSSILENFKQKNDQRVRTMAELNRIFNSYENLSNIAIVEIIMRKMPSKYLVLKNLNSFIKSEFSLDEELRQVITLKINPENTQIDELEILMSFAVSELEYIYPEFRFMVVNPYV